jgi:Ca2+-dependent lipid-binding protein
VILLLDGRSRRTEFVKNAANPVWNMVLDFDFPVQESLEDKVLEVNCYDHDIGKKDGASYRDQKIKKLLYSC